MDSIYEAKLNKSRSEAIYSHLESSSNAGTYKGVFYDKYLSNLNRFALSKELILKSNNFERTVLTNFVDKTGKIVKIRTYNFGLKAILGLIMVNSYINYRNNNEYNKLHRKKELVSNRGLVLSTLAFVGSITLI